MSRFRLGWLLAVGALLQSGCATAVNGTTQSVRVLTEPPGGSIIFDGRRVEHGQIVTVQKRLEPPAFNLGTAESPVMVDMTWRFDPWLVGDAGLLVVFVVPGLVGFGVDIASGAWRLLDDPQVVHLPPQP